MDQKKYFFADKDEKYNIESFAKFLKENKDKTIVHWSMLDLEFGFTSLENRYREIVGSAIKIEPTDTFDLSEYLKEKYGTNYVPGDGGRLNHLAKLNGFRGFKDKY